MLLGVRIAILIMWACLAPVRAEIVDHVVAAVDDEVITLSDLDWLVEFRVSRFHRTPSGGAASTKRCWTR